MMSKNGMAPEETTNYDNGETSSSSNEGKYDHFLPKSGSGLAYLMLAGEEDVERTIQIKDVERVIQTSDEETYRCLEGLARENCVNIFEGVQEGNHHVNLNEKEYIKEILPKEMYKLLSKLIVTYLKPAREF